MIRMVLVLILGAGGGAALGALMGGAMGSTLGVVLGMSFAVLWQSVRRTTYALPAGVPVQRERHRLLCIPNGQFADVVLAHDGRHWCDVESCTLCHPAERVACEKRCLSLMNDNYPPARERQPI